jgi:predicted site-specific integrase-resolvase
MRKFTTRTPEEQKERRFNSPWKQELSTDHPCQVYPRVSTPEQRENVSAEMQQDRRFAVLCGWSDDDEMIIVETDDLGLSGQLRMEERPAFVKMLRNIASGKVRVVIVANISRFFRRKWNDEAEKFMQICDSYGVKVIVPNPWRSGIEFVYDFSIRAHIEQFRRKCEEAWNYLEGHVYGTMLAAKAELGKAGRWEGGNLPPGYIPDRREKVEGRRNPDYRLFIPYDPHAEVTRWLFDRFWELAGNVRALLREIARREILFPAFESWVDKEIVAKMHCTKVFDEKGEIKGYTILSETGLRKLLSNPVYIGYWVYKGELISTENHTPLIDFHRFSYAFNQLSAVRLDGSENEEALARRNKYMKAYVGEKPAILKNHIVASDTGLRINVCPIMRERFGEQIGLVYYYSFFKRGDGVDKFKKYMITCADLDRIFLEHFIERLAHASDFENFLDKEQAETEARAQLENDLKRDINAVRLILAKLEKQVASGELADVPQLLNAAKESYKLHSAELVRLLDRQEKVTKDTSQVRKRRTYKQLMGDAYKYFREGRLDELIPAEEMPLVIDTFINKVIVEPLAPHFYKMYVHWCDPAWGADELVCYKDGNSSSQWTEKELAMLKQHYPTASRGKLIELLPARNYIAITWQAKQLGMQPRARELSPLPKSFCLQDWEIMQQYDLCEEELRAKKGGRLITWY